MCKNHYDWEIFGTIAFLQRTIYSKNWIFRHFLAHFTPYLVQMKQTTLKFAVILQLIKFQVISENEDNWGSFKATAYLQKAYLGIFTNLHPEDDVIAKIWWQILRFEFSRRFRKCSWFCCGTLEKSSKRYPFLRVVQFWYFKAVRILKTLWFSEVNGMALIKDLPYNMFTWPSNKFFNKFFLSGVVYHLPNFSEEEPTPSGRAFFANFVAFFGLWTGIKQVRRKLWVSLYHWQRVPLAFGKWSCQISWKSDNGVPFGGHWMVLRVIKVQINFYRMTKLRKNISIVSIGLF